MLKHLVWLSYENNPEKVSLGESGMHFDKLSLQPCDPKGNRHLMSPYNIIPESNINITRIMKMIHNLRSSWLLNKFSLLIF